MKRIQIDAAMCGGEFHGSVRRVAEYLTNHDYPAEAVENAVNETPSDLVIPAELWNEALALAEMAHTNMRANSELLQAMGLDVDQMPTNMLLELMVYLERIIGYRWRAEGK